MYEFRVVDYRQTYADYLFKQAHADKSRGFNFKYVPYAQFPSIIMSEHLIARSIEDKGHVDMNTMQLIADTADEMFGEDDIILFTSSISNREGYMEEIGATSAEVVSRKALMDFKKEFGEAESKGIIEETNTADVEENEGVVEDAVTSTIDTEILADIESIVEATMEKIGKHVDGQIASKEDYAFVEETEVVEMDAELLAEVVDKVTAIVESERETTIEEQVVSVKEDKSSIIDEDGTAVIDQYDGHIGDIEVVDREEDHGIIDEQDGGGRVDEDTAIEEHIVEGSQENIGIDEIYEVAKFRHNPTEIAETEESEMDTEKQGVVENDIQANIGDVLEGDIEDDIDWGLKDIEYNAKVEYLESVNKNPDKVNVIDDEPAGTIIQEREAIVVDIDKGSRTRREIDTASDIIESMRDRRQEVLIDEIHETLRDIRNEMDLGDGDVGFYERQQDKLEMKIDEVYESSLSRVDKEMIVGALDGGIRDIQKELTSRHTLEDSKNEKEFKVEEAVNTISLKYDYFDLLNDGMSVEEWEVGYAVPEEYDAKDPFNAYYPWAIEQNEYYLVQNVKWDTIGDVKVDRETASISMGGASEALMENAYDKYKFYTDIWLGYGHVKAGLLLKYEDENTHYKLLLDTYREPIQLIHVRDGQERKIAEPMQNMEIHEGTAYRVAVTMIDNRLTVKINGRLVYDLMLGGV